MERLIKRHASYDATLLSDALACYAANIEDAYLLAGARPGKDYSVNDVFTLAMRYMELTGTKNIGGSFHSDTTVCGQQ